ncbi:alkyl hydroperoxide reductase [Frondihabitans sp. PAMC 28766]|uniref:redoxin domain-containing protein n=1 Tax=Frondihabitans sp. PAMC 28766 TaxID=1795630 RepID=UPI00078B34FD|nr:peroxiredoxin [Frondihabitans sp. PAMC 28766]AMM20282.1 alkyl hydroperoxide reductase [Frondihabitans sp. PAMC 28766]
MSIPDIGDTAPDFTLPGVRLVDGETRRQEFTLSRRPGNAVVLVFYPADESTVCTAQLCSYQEELSGFADLGAEVWGISRQSLDSHENFARHHGLSFALLSDVDSRVIRDYGIALPGVGLRRSVFVIDAGGVVRWKHVALLGARFQKASVIQDALTDVLA